MELSFETLALREICEQSEKAEAELGIELAKKLHSRLADLIAIGNILELPVGNPEIIQEDRFAVCKIKLDNSSSLYFSANHRKKSLSYSNKADWHKITHIKILKILRNGKINT